MYTGRLPYQLCSGPVFTCDSANPSAEIRAIAPGDDTPPRPISPHQQKHSLFCELALTPGVDIFAKLTGGRQPQSQSQSQSGEVEGGTDEPIAIASSLGVRQHQGYYYCSSAEDVADASGILGNASGTIPPDAIDFISLCLQPDALRWCPSMRAESTQYSVSSPDVSSSSRSRSGTSGSGSGNGSTIGTSGRIERCCSVKESLQSVAAHSYFSSRVGFSWQQVHDKSLAVPVMPLNLAAIRSGKHAGDSGDGTGAGAGAGAGTGVGSGGVHPSLAPVMSRYGFSEWIGPATSTKDTPGTTPTAPGGHEYKAVESYCGTEAATYSSASESASLFGMWNYISPEAARAEIRVQPEHG